MLKRFTVILVCLVMVASLSTVFAAKAPITAPYDGTVIYRQALNNNKLWVDMQITATNGKTFKQWNLTEEKCGPAPGINTNVPTVVKQGTVLAVCQ